MKQLTTNIHPIKFIFSKITQATLKLNELRCVVWKVFASHFKRKKEMMAFYFAFRSHPTSARATPAQSLRTAPSSPQGWPRPLSGGWRRRRKRRRRRRRGAEQGPAGVDPVRNTPYRRHDSKLLFPWDLSFGRCTYYEKIFFDRLTVLYACLSYVGIEKIKNG